MLKTWKHKGTSSCKTIGNICLVVPLWNNISLDIRETKVLSTFKDRLFNYFFNFKEKDKTFEITRHVSTETSVIFS